MTLRLRDGNSNAFRAFVAALLFCGVIISIGLSAAPQLHEWLHNSNGTSHECAATLMSNGSWEHSTCEPLVTAPQQAPVTPSFVLPGVRVLARAETSVLEHAPPANS